MNDRQLIIIALVVIGIVLLWYAANKPPQTTEYDARNFVMNDAQVKYPEADIGILSTNYSSGSWKMKVKATLNASSPCPERIHLYYDYPAQQFATRLPEHITTNCEICLNVPECTIVFPEEALIASHTFSGAQDVQKFLDANPKATGSAEFKASYGKYSEVWVVRWNSDTHDMGWLEVVLDRYGKIEEIQATLPN